MGVRDRELNFIDPKVLFGQAGEDADAHAEGHGVHDAEDLSSVPKITRLPEGIEVIEQKVGRAVGTWILQVRCQCGRRWFETEPVDATHCPRCGMYVYIDVQAEPGHRS